MTRHEFCMVIYLYISAEFAPVLRAIVRTQCGQMLTSFLAPLFFSGFEIRLGQLSEYQVVT